MRFHADPDQAALTFLYYRCDCRTAEGRLLEGIRTEMLETVIPRYSKTLIIVTCTGKGGGGGGGGQISKPEGHFLGVCCRPSRPTLPLSNSYLFAEL